MDRSRGLWERIAEGVDLPGEALPGQPIVELLGDRRILIENHNGVTEYGREKICVRVRYGLLSISGCGLELTRMTKDNLVITGLISGVSLRRKRK